MNFEGISMQGDVDGLSNGDKTKGQRGKMPKPSNFNEISKYQC